MIDNTVLPSISIYIIYHVFLFSTKKTQNPKITAIFVGHHKEQTNTNNIRKTLTLISTNNWR
jgi:hypothetical protein